MRYGFIIVMLSLVGCNPTLRHPPVYSVDPVLEPYVEQFVAEAYAQGKPIRVTDLLVHFVDNLPSNIDGQCFFGSPSSSPKVQINSANWYNYETPLQNKVVMFHELGHCLLNREHVQDMITLPDGEWGPRSIMYPYILNGPVYDNNWSYYMWEMFHGI